MENDRHRIENAVTICKKYSSKLPLPTNDKENEKYRLAFLSLGAKTIGVALDLNDVKNEGNFVKFSDGQSPNWSNWYPGEPNNAYGNEDYGSLYLKRFPKNWNDYNRAEWVSIVCEKGCL